MMHDDAYGRGSGHSISNSCPYYDGFWSPSVLFWSLLGVDTRVDTMHQRLKQIKKQDILHLGTYNIMPRYTYLSIGRYFTEKTFKCLPCKLNFSLCTGIIEFSLSPTRIKAGCCKQNKPVQRLLKIRFNGKSIIKLGSGRGGFCSNTWRSLRIVSLYSPAAVEKTVQRCPTSTCSICIFSLSHTHPYIWASKVSNIPSGVTKWNILSYKLY